MKLIDIVAVEPVSAAKEVGIEIEVEGEYLPSSPTGWKQVHDGSLRGESCEYVFKNPVTRRTAITYLDRLDVAYSEAGTRVHESARQSVHVHINVQHMEMPHLFNFITLFLLFEKSLVQWCGEYREGNLFCLRSSDAEAMLTILEEVSFDREKFYMLNTNEIRYAALNLSAIFKYGSLEFRSMRGTADMSLIKKWVSVLLKLKDFASTVADPSVLVSMFSEANPRHFVRDVLGDDADVVFNNENWLNDNYVGLRNIQQVCYLGDWDEYRGEVRQQRQHRQRSLGEVLRERANRWTPSYEEHEGGDEYEEEEDWVGEEEEDEEAGDIAWAVPPTAATPAMDAISEVARQMASSIDADMLRAMTAPPPPNRPAHVQAELDRMTEQRRARRRLGEEDE